MKHCAVVLHGPERRDDRRALRGRCFCGSRRRRFGLDNHEVRPSNDPRRAVASTPPPTAMLTAAFCFRRGHIGQGLPSMEADYTFTSSSVHSCNGGKTWNFVNLVSFGLTFTAVALFYFLT